MHKHIAYINVGVDWPEKRTKREWSDLNGQFVQFSIQISHFKPKKS